MLDRPDVVDAEPVGKHHLLDRFGQQLLLVALGPIGPAWMATAVVAGGLVALTYSFAVDVRWALAHGPSSG